MLASAKDKENDSIYSKPTLCAPSTVTLGSVPRECVTVTYGRKLSRRQSHLLCDTMQARLRLTDLRGLVANAQTLNEPALVSFA
jgi:hypothetical protein